MKLRSVLISTTTCLLLSSASYAATVTLNVSGSTAGSSGTLNYTSGSTFTARLTFDNSFVDVNPDTRVGSFYDFQAASTALQTFELTTEFGTVRYDVADVDPVSPVFAYLAPQVSQRDIFDQQGLTVISHGGGSATQNGWRGAFGALAPNNFSLTLGASGPSNYFFDDANSLFSGFENGFSDSDAVTTGGIITLSQFGGFDTTTLRIGAGEYSIVGDDAPISPVPLPATLPLMAFGLFGLGCAARHRKQGA